MAQILLQDNFTGTTIDTGKWTETDTNGLVSQNNALILSNPHTALTSDFSNMVKSVASISSGVAVAQANITWTTDSSQEALGGLYLYKDNNNFAAITSRGAGGYYRLRVVTGGVSRYNLETTGSDYAKGKDVKIWTNGTDIKFFTWNGSSWVQIGTTQTYSLGYSLYEIIGTNDNTTFTGANPVTVDNAYFSDQDYTTQYPNFDLTLGEYLGAGSGTTKLLWHLNGNANDSSGNSNNGTVSGATVASGKFGQCYSFDGSNDYIYKTNFTGMPNNGADMTYVFWLKPSSITLSTYMEFYAFGESTAYSGVGLRFRMSTGGHLEKYYAYYGGFETQTTNNFFQIDTWVNLIIVMTSNAYKIFKNGLIIESGSLNYPSTVSTKELNLGGDRWQGRYFPGLIDETFIENRAWSAEEVKKYYTNSLGRYATL